MLSFNFVKFFAPKYLFDLHPLLPSVAVRNSLIVVFSLLLILGIVFVLIAKIKKRDILLARILRKFYSFCLTLGILGWLFLFFRLEKAYFLSGRFWLAFWFITAVLWLIYIVRYVLYKLPLQKKEIIQKQEFERYLPKKK